MKFIIFTTKYDKSEKLITKEAKKTRLICQTYYYEDLVYDNGKIFDSNLNSLSVDRNDKIILRDPYNAKFDYSFFTRQLLEKYYKNVALDRQCYSEFPFYEDKLFQADVFSELKISTPETYFGKNTINFVKYPVIIKPRIGSRSRGIHIISNPEKMRMFFTDKEPLNFVVQKYYKADNEYRLLILRHNMLGVVDKSIYLKAGGRVGVRINKKVDDIPLKIKKDSIEISKCLRADFIGVDVICTDNGNYYFLEANISPQFTGFTKVTKINIAEKVLEVVLS